MVSNYNKENEAMRYFIVFIVACILYCSIEYGLNILHGLQSENKSLKKSLKVIL